MAKKISDLTEITDPASVDSLPLNDTVAGVDKRITVGTLTEIIAGRSVILVDSYSSIDTANVASGDVLLFSAGTTYTATSDITISKDMIFEPGAVLSALTGVTVTINGAPNLYNHRNLIFSGAGDFILGEVSERWLLFPEWFGSIQNTIDSIPKVSPAAGGGGYAVISLAPKEYNENVVIGSDTETQDILLRGSAKYQTIIDGGSTGIAVDVKQSRVGLMDFYARTDSGSSNSAIRMASTTGDTGTSGSYITRVGIPSSGRDGLEIISGLRYRINDMQIYNCDRHGVTLGTSSNMISQLWMDQIAVREIDNGNYGFNIVNAGSGEIRAHVNDTNTPVYLGNGGGALTLNIESGGNTTSDPIRNDFVLDTTDAAYNATSKGHVYGRSYSLNPQISNVSQRILPVSTHFNLVSEGNDADITFTNTTYQNLYGFWRRENLDFLRLGGLGKGRNVYARLRVVIQNETTTDAVYVRVFSDAILNSPVLMELSTTNQGDWAYVRSDWVRVESDWIDSLRGSQRFRMEVKVDGGQGKISAQTPGLVFALDMSS